MLFDILPAVLLETLEVAILISLVFSMRQRHLLGLVPLLVALLLGTLLAVIYAQQIASISTWFDYRGQESVSAAVQTLAALLLILGAAGAYQQQQQRQWPLLVVVALATMMEGAEIMLVFVGKLAGNLDQIAMAGVLIGFGVGASVSVLVYYVMFFVPRRWQALSYASLFTLMGAGMALQAAQQLAQAGWLPPAAALWSSEWLCSEASILGKLLFAMFGYESTPSRWELLAWGSMLVLGATLVFIQRQHPTAAIDSEQTR